MKDDAYYLQRAHEAAEAARRKVPHYRGGCSECAYSRAHILDERTCAHPAVELAAFNATRAYNKEQLQQCSTQREDHSVWGPVVCGPNGVLFERRRSLWSRLFDTDKERK